MNLSLSLLLLLAFSLPAVVQMYVFQYFSRIRRPLETNPTMSLASLLLGATLVHSIMMILIDWFGSGNLSELSLFFLERLVLDASSELPQNNYQNPLEFALDMIQYVGLACLLGSVSGAVIARLAAYGLKPFDLIGRLYYGGLYATFRGFLSRDVFVSVVASNQIDNKTILYNGFLEELRLRESGEIEYVTISQPRKAIVMYDDSVENIISQKERSIQKARIAQKIEENYIDKGRLILEGNSIANIYLHPQKFRSTLESFIGKKLDFAIKSVKRLVNHKK